MLLSLAIGLSALVLLALTLNPVIGISLLFIIKPLVDASFDQPVFAGFRLTEIVAGSVPLLMVLHMCLGRREESIRLMPLRGLWLLYAAEILLFSLILVYHDSLKTGASIFLRYINGFIGFYMIQAYFRRPEKFKVLLLSLMAAGLLPVSVGCYETFTGRSWRVEQAEGVVRAVGLWHDSVNLREYAFQTMLALLLYGVLYARNTDIARAARGAYFALATVVLLKTFSKAATITLVLWTCVWSYFRKRYVLLIGVMLVGTVLGTLLASRYLGSLLQVFHREIGFLSGKGDLAHTFAGRWYGWKEMMEQWMHLPLMAKVFGSGRLATGAHNDYLQMLFHGGLLGLSLYLALLGTVGLRLIRQLRANVEPVGVAALMVYLMWMVDTIGLVPSAYPAYQWFVWGLIGLSLRLREDSSVPAAATAHPSPAAEVGRVTDAFVRRPVQGRRYPIVSG